MFLLLQLFLKKIFFAEIAKKIKKQKCISNLTLWLFDIKFNLKKAYIDIVQHGKASLLLLALAFSFMASKDMRCWVCLCGQEAERHGQPIRPLQKMSIEGSWMNRREAFRSGLWQMWGLFFLFSSAYCSSNYIKY